VEYFYQRKSVQEDAQTNIINTQMQEVPQNRISLINPVYIRPFLESQHQLQYPVAESSLIDYRTIQLLNAMNQHLSLIRLL